MIGRLPWLVIFVEQLSKALPVKIEVSSVVDEREGIVIRESLRSCARCNEGEAVSGRVVVAPTREEHLWVLEHACADRSDWVISTASELC